MKSAARPPAGLSNTGRFIALLILASGLAFAVGTRSLSLRSAPTRSVQTHPVTGRVVPGMATNGAWMDRRERSIEEEPDRALALIGIEPGMTVADIGAGTGYMTARLASLVGASGHVFANEIQPAMLRTLAERVRQQQLTNVEVVAGAVDDVHLPAASVDVALLVDVYHELQKPQPIVQSIRRALRAEGRLVVIEYRQEDPRLAIAPTHRMSVAGLRAEIEPEGFRLDSVIEELPRQHIVAFRVRRPE